MVCTVILALLLAWVSTKTKGRTGLLNEVKRRAQRPEIVRAWARRNQNQVGERQYLSVLLGQGRRRVDKVMVLPGLAWVEVEPSTVKIDRRREV